MTRKPVCVTRDGLLHAKTALQNAQAALESARQKLRQGLSAAMPQVDAGFAAELNAFLEAQEQLAARLNANWNENGSRLDERAARLSEYCRHGCFVDEDGGAAARIREKTLTLGGTDGNGGDVFTVVRDGYRVDARPYTPPAENPFDPGDVVDDIALLPATRQANTQTRNSDDELCTVFDNPDALSFRVATEQGINKHNLPDTCVSASLANWLCKIIGNENYPEASVVDYAVGKGYCSEKGGMRVEDVPKLWHHFGLKPVCAAHWDAQACARAVESGCAVGIGVQSARLWGGWAFQSANDHMIDVVSVKRGPDGQIQSFYIVDTGRGMRADACREVPWKTLEQAISPRNFLMISSGGAVW